MPIKKKRAVKKKTVKKKDVKKKVVKKKIVKKTAKRKIVKKKAVKSKIKKAIKKKIVKKAKPKKRAVKKKIGKPKFKKIVRRTVKKAKEKPIGKVTHYFNNIKVAVIKFSVPISVGAKIRIQGGEVDFIQEIKSMESNHKRIKRAKKGASVGLKVKKKIREGYKAYKA